MPDIFPESRDEAILLSMINGEEYTGFPESRIEVLLLQLKATLEDWKSKTKGAYVFHGSIEFSELPSTLTEDMVGWTYNMLEEFTTDDRFVDGAGKVYPAGTNVAIANVGTDETQVLKFDVTSAFVDVNAIYSAIDNIADMIADEFDEDEAYAVGDIVWHVDDLYTFVSPHTAGDSWSNLEVNMTTVDEIINAIYTYINNTISDIEDMIANQFNAATAYSEGDYVIYQNGLYKFTSDHAAGAAWDPFIVSSIDVTAAIKQAESDLATLSGYFAAMSDTVSDLEDQVDIIQDAISEEKTASGNPITVTDALPYNAVSLSAEIEASQDLHGLPFPYVGGAYKNKLDFKAALDYWGADYTDNGDGSYTITRVGSGYSTLYQFAPSPSVVSISAASIVSLTTGSNWRIEIFDETDGWKSIGSATLSQAGVNANKIRLNYSNHGDGVTFSKVQIELGSSVTSYAPYSNICPISGRTEARVDDTGRNQLPLTVASIKAANTGGTWSGNAYIYRGIVYTMLTDSADNITGINVNGNNTGTSSSDLWIPVNQTIDGILNGCPSGGSSSTYLQTVWSDQGGHVASDTGSGVSVAGIAITSMSIRVRNGVTISNKVFYPMIRSSSDTDPTFVPYAHSSATIQLGQTVYGGTLNVTTGVLTIIYAFIIYDGSSDEEWSASIAGSGAGYRCRIDTPTGAKIPSNNGETANIICNQFKAKTANQTYLGNEGVSIQNGGGNPLDVYSVSFNTSDISLWKTFLSNNPLQICYELATPITIQLTPTQLTMLKGYNRLSSDGGGEITLTYKANKADSVQAEVDVLDANKAEKTTIAPVENGTKASKAYAVGEHFIRNKKFCTAIAAIASGATLTLNTNYVEGTIADAITELANANIYSADEVKIGKWGNKDLYRKVIDFGALPNADTKTVSSGLSNITVRNLYGSAIYQNIALTLPDISTDYIRLFYSDGNVGIATSIDRSNYTAEVVLEYTKNPTP